MSDIEPLPAGMTEALRESAAYPLDPSADSGIGEVQTHISHVYLTRERVYKLRKAVELSFLSFATREARNADCLREIALNRRLAEDVYLGVAPVDRTRDAVWRVGAVAETLCTAGSGHERPEHCVVMRRLPDGRDASALLRRGELGPEHIDAVARRMAEFHARHGLGIPAPYSAREWLERVEKPVVDTLQLARNARIPELPEAAITQLEKELSEFLEQRRSKFLQRREAGRVVDGHGDLHLAHVWFEAGPDRALIIDCIEFNDELRHLDSAAELAFFSMDLAYRGRGDLAERFLRRYAEETDDFALYGVLDYHIVHRALVRAAVAGIAAGEPEIDESQRRAAAHSAGAHLAFATKYMNRPDRAGVVVICGPIGTGKSTVAELVADELQGAVVSSDRTRKRLAGLDPVRRAAAPAGEGIYSETWTRRTYGGLLERAEQVLDGGRVAVLDATYSEAAERSRVRELAARRNVPALLIEVRCAEPTVYDRLVERERSRRSVSDAGPALMEASARRFEPPLEWPPSQCRVVRTDDSGWRDRLRRELRSEALVGP